MNKPHRDQPDLRHARGSGAEPAPCESSRKPATPADGVELGALLIQLMELCRQQLAAGIVLSLNSRLGGETYVNGRDARALEFVICEIVSNAYRFAHPEGAPVEITIECRAAAHGEIIIDIGDDGVGLAPDFAEWRDGGDGMAAVRAQLQEIDAALDVTTDDLGLRFQIVLNPSLRLHPQRGNFVWL